MLTVFTRNEFHFVLALLWQVIPVTLYLYKWLCLLGALDGNETRTALVIVRAFLVDLVSKAILSDESRNWHPIDSINLHRLHGIEFDWTLE